MELRRRTDGREPERRPGQGPPEGGETDALRAQGDAFLAAGDEAIRRALSGDSEAFLRASRQEGGQ